MVSNCISLKVIRQIIFLTGVSLPNNPYAQYFLLLITYLCFLNNSFKGRYIMARYRKIDTRIWNDKKFNELSDHGKLAFFLLLTHPHLTPIGAMRASLPGLASELRWPLEKLQQALEESFLQDMVRHDESASFMWLPNFLKYNQPESPNVVRSWENHLDYLPECTLKNSVIEHIKSYTQTLSPTFQEALPQSFGKSMPNQEQEQEQEQKDILSSKQKNSQLKSQAIEVLNFLNEKTGKKFRPVDTNLKIIIARLKTGATVVECRQIIAMKYREWRKNPDMVKYVRPETLFSPKKFESYIGELVIPKDDSL